MSEKICVTGAGGLIGSHICRLLQKLFHGNKQIRIIGLTRNQLDLAKESEVREYFEKLAPQAVIHCAGLTSNPACEKDPAVARLLNVCSPGWIFESVPDAWVCHFSTDLVFDGLAGNYVENDPVSPVGIYAETKAESELIASVHPVHCIIRTSLNAGISPTGDRGFNEKLRQAWAAGHELSLFTDEYRCPIPAEWTARIVVELMKRRCTGIYHVAGSEKLSRYDIAMCLAAQWSFLEPRLRASSIRDYTGPPRSPDCSMDCSKVTRATNLTAPGFSEYVSANLQLLL